MRNNVWNESTHKHFFISHNFKEPKLQFSIQSPSSVLRSINTFLSRNSLTKALNLLSASEKEQSRFSHRKREKGMYLCFDLQRNPEMTDHSLWTRDENSARYEQFSIIHSSGQISEEYKGNSIVSLNKMVKERRGRSEI